MDSRRYLGVVDYVIFGVTLLISSVIGIYFGCKKRREVASPTEYLLAGRDVPWFPIFVSLVVSFLSPVGVMGLTAQVYATGVTFAFQAFTLCIPIGLNAWAFAPIFRKLRLISVNEYLERRFSKKVRLLGSFFFILQFLLYLSVVLYAPSLALETAANVPKVTTMLITGVICTFYTTLGGMRAVIWTDVFQAVIMMVGLLTTVVVGVVNVGSISEVFEIAKKHKRLDINYDFDPRAYHTIWGSFIGITFVLLNGWTITQPTVQRVVSTKSLRDARRALFFSIWGITLVALLLAFVSLVIFASFADCDLMLSGQINAVDQILPYFVVTKLGKYQGIPGVFVSSLFSFSLSTLSSALNSMSAIILEDIVKTFQPSISEERQTIVSKVIVCLCGAFMTGFAFVVPLIGKFIIKISIQLFGVIGGPYFAMFALGVFTRRANSIGVSIGSLTGFFVGMVLSIGQMFYPPDMQLPPVSLANCPNGTVHGNFNSTLIFLEPPPKPSNIFAHIVSISYMWYGVISISLTCVVGYIASVKSHKSSEIDPDLMFNHSSCFTCNKKKDEFECEIFDKELVTQGPFAHSPSTSRSTVLVNTNI